MEYGFRLKAFKELLHYYTSIISVLDKTTAISPPKIIHVEEENKGHEIDP